MADPTVSNEPVIVGNLRIPAENFAEYQQLTDEIHEFIAAGKPVPKSLRLRAYIIEGMEPAHAKWVVEHGELGECNDTHDVD